MTDSQMSDAIQESLERRSGCFEADEIPTGGAIEEPRAIAPLAPAGNAPALGHRKGMARRRMFIRPQRLAAELSMAVARACDDCHVSWQDRGMRLEEGNKVRTAVNNLLDKYFPQPIDGPGQFE